MEESLLKRFMQGQLTVEQILQAANNPEYIKRELVNRNVFG